LSEEHGNADVLKDDPRHSHIRSYALRRSHITQGQRHAYERVFPKFSIAPTRTPLDFAQVFGRAAPTVLEIGFGMGETTATIAQARPDLNFLCIEVFVAGIGALCKRIDEMSLENIRIIQHDAVEVVRDMLTSACLAGVHIYFPDPWPKLRHHKRRLVAQPFIGRLVDRIAPHGYLHCATDWANYAEQMMAVLGSEARLRNLHQGYAASASNPLCDRPTTKFHARGLRLGHQAWDSVFERI
jgi:tRNA (guanine-N7-)-methyltransferase